MSFGAFRLFTQDKPVVNTSLPAQQAPKLQPGTLAAITSSNAPTPPPTNSFLSRLKQEKQMVTASKMYNVNNMKKSAVPSDDDFPALGSKKPVAATTVEVKPATSFSDLAKDWAKKQQDEKEQAKYMTEVEQGKKKLDYYERLTLQVNSKLQKLQVNKKVEEAEEEEVELPPQDDYETYEEPVEEEEEEEYDPTVDYKRNRNELSTF